MKRFTQLSSYFVTRLLHDSLKAIPENLFSASDRFDSQVQIIISLSKHLIGKWWSSSLFAQALGMKAHLTFVLCKGSLSYRLKPANMNLSSIIIINSSMTEYISSKWLAKSTAHFWNEKTLKIVKEKANFIQ